MKSPVNLDDLNLQQRGVFQCGRRCPPYDDRALFRIILLLPMWTESFARTDSPFWPRHLYLVPLAVLRPTFANILQTFAQTFFVHLNVWLRSCDVNIFMVALCRPTCIEEHHTYFFCDDGFSVFFFPPELFIWTIACVDVMSITLWLRSVHVLKKATQHVFCDAGLCFLIVGLFQFSFVHQYID